jgi:hypothetical protein
VDVQILLHKKGRCGIMLVKKRTYIYSKGALGDGKKRKKSVG